MPLYEYQCATCGSVFEVMQKFADTPLTVHENCGGEVHRLLTAPALQFKGSGWYITDYGRGGKSEPKGEGEKKSDEKKSDEKKAGTTKSSDSGSDSKSGSGSDSSSSSKPSTSSTPSSTK